MWRHKGKGSGVTYVFLPLAGCFSLFFFVFLGGGRSVRPKEGKKWVKDFLGVEVGVIRAEEGGTREVAEREEAEGWRSRRRPMWP